MVVKTSIQMASTASIQMASTASIQMVSTTLIQMVSPASVQSASMALTQWPRLPRYNGPCGLDTMTSAASIQMDMTPRENGLGGRKDNDHLLNLAGICSRESRNTLATQGIFKSNAHYDIALSAWRSSAEPSLKFGCEVFSSWRGCGASALSTYSCPWSTNVLLSTMHSIQHILLTSIYQMQPCIVVESAAEFPNKVHRL